MLITSRSVALRAGLAAVAITGVLTSSFLAGSNAARVDHVRDVAATQDESRPVEGSMLKSGDELAAGEEITSANGEYTLRMQLDGNLVLLEGERKVVWHAGTAPNPGASAHMQRDGNLVVRSATNESLWDTGTQGDGATAHVQNDGNMTVRNVDGEVLWAVSAEIAEQARLLPGEALRAGDERHSRNGEYTLRMQLDGNLVLLEGERKVVWHAGTAPNPGASAHMQRDGNLVVRSATNESLWDTGTQGDGATAHVQNDGNLTVRGADGRVLWSRSMASR